MLRSKKRWKILKQDETLCQLFVDELQISSLVASLLINRGIRTVEEAKRFLFIENTAFHDPFLMKGMSEAVHRIEQAIKLGEKILIFGDYDADGVSSTAVIIHTLMELGATFDFYIPNRFTEGYGPNEPALRLAKEKGFSLVITVDTGISAEHEANIAKEIGLDFIITDHHEPPPVLPDAYAIVNPKQKDCPYPFKGLAGVGVAFKLAHALLKYPPEQLLDIAVIGTICDLVPLVDENRLMAKKGMIALQRTKRPGLVALKKLCGTHGKEINADHVGFNIGPRMNAAGRLDSAIPAVQLLISTDENECNELAQYIDDLNKQRQGIVNEITEQAVQMVEEQYASLQDHKVLVVAKEGWNSGVIGIVASRLVERYYRPTIVLSIDREKGIAKGSARSIEGFDMYSNLSKCRQILPHFGGHPMAAGLTISLDDIDELRMRLLHQAGDCLVDEDFIPITKVDLAVSIKDVQIKVIEEMSLLAPFGVSNPTPKIAVTNAQISEMRKIGSEETHLKVTVHDDGNSLECVGFHCGYLCDEIASASKINAVGTLSINEWNGYSKPQLFIEDISVNHWQLFDFRGSRNFTKLHQLPREKMIAIYFQEQTLNEIDLGSDMKYIHMNKQYDATNIDFTGKYVVLLDLPNHKDQLIRVFCKESLPDRIYAIFHQHENHYFTTVPSREHFKWFYSFLFKQKTFDVHKYGKKLAQHKGWSENTIHFMVKVFFELDFVTIENGLITLLESKDKRDLSQSETYRRKQEQTEIEKELFYSSYVELKNFLEQHFKHVDAN